MHNHTNAPCVYLDIRTFNQVDVAHYPDSGKVAVLPTMEVFSQSNKADYYDGEDKVEEIWQGLTKAEK